MELKNANKQFKEPELIKIDSNKVNKKMLNHKKAVVETLKEYRDSAKNLENYMERQQAELQKQQQQLDDYIASHKSQKK